MTPKLTKAARTVKEDERLCPRCEGCGHWVEKHQICGRCMGIGKIAATPSPIESAESNEGNSDAV